jgi:propionyl-CoA synthetase
MADFSKWHAQDEYHALSLEKPESFWMHQAQNLHWHKPPTKAIEHKTKTLENGVQHPHWTWFPDGEISTCYNCVDRHVLAGNGDRTAIIWNSPVTGQAEKYTYAQLLTEVEVLGGVLREEGVKRGHVVLIYMPMIPAALIAMLAINRIGANHAVVFGGFSPPALAQRIEGSRPVVIMTASCGIEAGKKPIGYQTLIRSAIEKSSHKPKRTIVWQREELRWQPINKEEGERNWQRVVKSARNRGVRAAATPVKSNEGVYIIYTSGTTGLPKGILRENAGHVVGLDLSIRYLFGIGPGDVIFTASDIGWVVGHSFILYAPLLAGATTVQFEGKPTFPDAGIFWRTIQENKVNVLFTAPTALRAIRQADPNLELLSKVGSTGGLKSLRAIFLAGERSEPSIVQLFAEQIKKYGAPNALVVDNWWSSESGSPITGLAQHPAIADNRTDALVHRSLPMKAGSAGKPMPGFDVRIVDDAGKECPRGKMGNIVLGVPLAPTGMTTLWEDDNRFWKSYLSRFDGKYVDTGDAGVMDEDGYVHVMSRADDIINVAAHRFSTGKLLVYSQTPLIKTGAIEQAICSHPGVAEACVVGIPDDLKGHLPFAFVSLGANAQIATDELYSGIQGAVREQIGAIARLGGMIEGKGMIPKTRSGKTLRRVLRELVENAVVGEYDKEVQVPSTVEDAEVVGVARRMIKQYFEAKASNASTRSVKAKM